MKIAITGAAGGIGSALVRRLVDASHDVAGLARSLPQLAESPARIKREFAVTDFQDIDSVDKIFEEVSGELGGLDAIVNCSGSLLLKPAHITSGEELQEAVHANLTSAFAVVKAAGKLMRSTGGHVVLMGSAAGRTGLANHEAIGAVKAAVAGLARSAAASYADRGIRVNVVAPGLVRTPMTSRIWQHEATEKASVAMHALQRLGEPDDIAACIEWLLSPAAGWITGEVFGVDGGLAKVRAKN